MSPVHLQKSNLLPLNLSFGLSIFKKMMDTRRLRLPLLVVMVLAALPAFAQVGFSDLDLAADNRLLFRARADFPGHGSYDTLFLGNVETGELSQLTVFPEQVQLLRDGTVLQIQNRFGVFRSDSEMNRVKPIARFPSFVGQGTIQEGKVSPMSASPDGRYLVFFSPTSAAYGDLVLLDTVDDSEHTIAEDVELSLSTPPVRWSPDSAYFIYGKAQELYYFSISQLENDRLLSEGLRRIGEGTIANVRWGRDGELYYVSGTIVYQILAAELFTRSLYQELLSIGTIVGRIPFSFDPNFDSFWISPLGTDILFNKGGSHLFLYRLGTEDLADEEPSFSWPYLLIPRNTNVEAVLWSPLNTITVFTRQGLGDDASTAVYRMVPAEDGVGYDVTRLDATGIRGMVLSPDALTAAVLTEEGVSVRDYESFEELESFTHPDPLHAAWINSVNLVVSGGSFTEIIDTDRRRRRFVTLSQPTEFGFDSETGAVMTQIGSIVRSYSPEEEGWENARDYDVRSRRIANGSYRVYLDETGSGALSNLIMVRNVVDLGTEPLFPAPDTNYDPFPAAEVSSEGDVFEHGSRIRRRELSLVFNAVDNVEGLHHILAVLLDFDIRATFFVNGDFIQRHPGAVREIAEAGHEVGSLFYTYFNMSDARFQISADFVRQGLARNEDSYFDVTGRELSLLWHTPFYFVSPAILQASREMSYTYIGRDVDSLDWVPYYGPSGPSRLYLPSAELVERIMAEKLPGSIVSMTVGKPRGDGILSERRDYLFHSLDLLINNLLQRGYNIVPVSTLLEHAR